MERLHAVDALRALALLGILSVNIWYFAFPENLAGGGRSAGLGETGSGGGAGAFAAADQWVAFAATAIFEGKSYVIFSFLFGLAFVLQWSSAHRAGVSEVSRSQRRFAGLVVLGLLHGIFLFVGDILLAYAVLGFALLGLRRISTRAALLLAAGLWTVVALALLGLGALTWWLESAPMLEGAAMTEGAGMSPEAMESSGLIMATEEARAAYTGSLGSYLAFQLEAYALVAPSMLLVQGPIAFAAFLLGLVIGRARMIEQILAGEIATTRLVSVMLPALAVGGGLSVTAAWMVWGGEPGAGGLGAETLSAGLIFLAGPVQATGYVLAVLLILRHRGFSWLVRLLAPAGRMSLSNYLGQSLVLALIFSALGAPLGLGLAGQLSASQVGGVIVGLWLGQLGISHLWLRFFDRGPMEAPLRAWTYAAKPLHVKPTQDHPSA
ncbi:DUF418 domain-containing protein [Nesterenkonia sp. E16_7]|uniref:DUF418 domain-containing protein n=1 Tax=unclassified Nesterenkonia TaxID=2629769 RepID=UPI001A90EEAE|nr:MULTISPECIES: DUF418 domain-containing protein [unclassified Nesterenkonia]MBO0596621.1 DUF418 domain-containing protein [Nesterenkonia sp. E16_10]MBO0597987.1 DUF418 domain-containing protein [Nesterenkonia sp. E16_7]